MMEQRRSDRTEIRAELTELRKRLQALEEEYKNSTENKTPANRKWFCGKFVITVIALLGLLSAGGLLHGQAAVEALFIDKDGNVGIGTSAPTANLDVAGTVKANDFATPEGVSLGNVQRDLNALNLHVPIGTIMAYGGDTTDPVIVDRLKKEGWLPCNGAPVSREAYKDLYNVIGAAFGADSPATFQLPDMRGRFLRGVDQGTGRDPDVKDRYASQGGKNGDQVGSLQNDIFGRHYHQYTIFPSDRGNIASGRYWKQGQANTTEAGGNETRPKNIYVNWIIKAKHMLPRQFQGTAALTGR